MTKPSKPQNAGLTMSAGAYWKSVDAETGRRIEAKVRAGHAPKPVEGMGEG